MDEADALLSDLGGLLAEVAEVGARQGRQEVSLVAQGLAATADELGLARLGDELRSFALGGPDALRSYDRLVAWRLGVDAGLALQSAQGRAGRAPPPSAPRVPTEWSVEVHGVIRRGTKVCWVGRSDHRLVELEDRCSDADDGWVSALFGAVVLPEQVVGSVYRLGHSRRTVRSCWVVRPSFELRPVRIGNAGPPSWKEVALEPAPDGMRLGLVEGHEVRVGPVLRFNLLKLAASGRKSLGIATHPMGLQLECVASDQGLVSVNPRAVRLPPPPVSTSSLDLGEMGMLLPVVKRLLASKDHEALESLLVQRRVTWKNPVSVWPPLAGWAALFEVLPSELLPELPVERWRLALANRLLADPGDPDIRTVAEATGLLGELFSA